MLLSPTGVPILSKTQIDRMAEKYIVSFNPDILKLEQSFPAEEFCESYLKLKVEYQYLSHNGCYLGMAVFSDHTRIPLYESSSNSVRHVYFDANTILLENTLVDEMEEARLRFTQMHECAHQVLHANYFRRLGDKDTNSHTLCRRDEIENNNAKALSQWSDIDRMEWQANYLASAFLMPAATVRSFCDMLHVQEYYDARTREGWSEQKAFDMAALDLTYAFGVSLMTAKIRLLNLGFKRKRIAV